MDVTTRVKLVQDNPVPTIADAIDNAIQHAIDLEHVTICEARIEAGTADGSTSLWGIAQKCDRRYAPGTARRPPRNWPALTGGPFCLQSREFYRPQITPSGNERSANLGHKGKSIWS
jgi:hypothetical protein